MPFTVSDFNDFKQLLVEHPEWRIELGRMLWAEEMEEIRAILRDVAESQQRSEQRLAEFERRTDERFAGLAEAQRRTDERFAELAEAQRRTEERLGRLADAQRRTDERLTDFQVRTEEHFARLENRVGRLEGRSLEHDYRVKAASYFGPWLRRPRVVDVDTLWDELEGRLTRDEFDDLLAIDLLVRGRPRQAAEGEEVWLAVEVSATVDEHDVVRAVRRAGLLRRAGYRVVPVVAGQEATAGAEAESRSRGVAMLEDSSRALWEEALAAWGG